MKSISIHGPQVGDIVRVKPAHVSRFGVHMGLVTRLIEWPDNLNHLNDCTIFLDPNLVNPVQIQTKYLDIVSRAAR